MNDDLERYRRRKAILDQVAEHPRPILICGPKAASDSPKECIELNRRLIELIQSDDPRIAELESCDISASKEEVEHLLDSLANNWDEEKFEEFLKECFTKSLQAIITPFGLGQLLALADKDGGNVTTINNAKQSVYANEEDRYKRSDYDHTKNSEGQSFAGGKSSAGAEFMRNQLDAKGNVVDEYTGKTHASCQTSPDHIEPLSNFHKNGGFMLSKERKANFATDKRNLAVTERKVNQSMKDSRKSDWFKKKKSGTDKTNGEHYEADQKAISEKQEQGENVAREHAPGTTDKVKYYGQGMAKSGTGEGLKMGFQQAVGMLIFEFYSSVFSEAKDIFRNGYAHGFESAKFLGILMERLKRIGNKVLAKWKDALSAFGEGFVSGFLSNMITVIVNMFQKTAKNMVRIIREGFFSLLKAIRMIACPPAGTTKAEAAHAATKLIAAGVMVIAGVAAEEAVSAFLAPYLGPFTGVATAVIIGGTVGLMTTFIVYAIDKLDLFGTQSASKHDFIMQRLKRILEEPTDAPVSLDALLIESAPGQTT